MSFNDTLSLFLTQGKLYDYWKPLPEDEMPTKKESQINEQGDTEESLSEESDIVHSDEEECMEEKFDVPVESEEKPDDSAEKIQEKHDEFQEVLPDIKEKESLINLDNSDAEELKDDVAIDEELLGESSEGSIENDEDEDLIKREEELLKDDESLDRNGALVGGENDEPEKLELLGKHADILEKANEELLLDE